MKLASLYSGGKDSTFSMYLAEQMGHDVPIMVNIVPEDRASWIFHTPNLGAVPAMAEAMGKELVTARSTGTDPFENESEAVLSSERRIQDAVMMLIERASLFPIFS